MMMMMMMERGSHQQPFSLSGPARHPRVSSHQQQSVRDSAPLSSARLSSASCGGGSAPIKNTRERLTGAPGEFSLSLASQSTAPSAFGSTETLRSTEVRLRHRTSATQLRDSNASSPCNGWASAAERGAGRAPADLRRESSQAKTAGHPHASGFGSSLRVLFFTVVAVLFFPVFLFSRWHPVRPTAPAAPEPVAPAGANTTHPLEDSLSTVSAAQSEMRAALDAALDHWKSLDERDAHRTQEITLLHEKVESLQTALQAVRTDTQGMFENLAALRAAVEKQAPSHETLDTFKLRMDAFEDRLRSLGEDLAATRKQAEKADEGAAAAEKRHYEKQATSRDALVQPVDTLELANIKKMLFDVQRLVYDDGTGAPDWARASLGGSIVTQFTSPPRRTSLWNNIKWKIITLFPRYYGKALPPPRPADVVIGSVGLRSAQWGAGAAGSAIPTPGNCFAFDGAKGNITIRLPTLLNVTEVHVDHVSPKLVVSVATAPQDFAVYVDDCERLPCTRRVNFPFPPSKRVGSFRFENPKKGVVSQTFALHRGGGREPRHLLSRRVRFEFLSNHEGDYTCIYRLRVHGQRSGVQA